MSDEHKEEDILKEQLKSIPNKDFNKIVKILNIKDDGE